MSKKTNRLTAMYLTRYIVVGGGERGDGGRESEGGGERGGGRGGREREGGGRERERTRRYTISPANELWLLVIRKDTDVYFRGTNKQTNNKNQKKNKTRKTGNNPQLAH